MSKWPTVKLGELLLRSEESFMPEADTEYREITVRMRGKGVVERGRALGATFSGRRFLARAGQFIASRIDARNGAMGLVPESLDGAVVTNDFPLFNLNVDRLEPAFLAWLSRTQDFVELCLRASEGTTNRVRLKEATFLATEIPLPPLSEQRRVVARIEELSAQIHEARTLRHQATQEAESLVISLHKQLSGNRIVKLGDVVELDEEAIPIVLTGSYPQVGVRSFGAGLFPKDAVVGSGTTYRTFNRLYDGALVLSQVKGWEGALAICPPALAGWYVSPEYRTFRCRPTDARPGYLAPIIRTEWFWKRLGNATRGVGARRERTRPEQFLNLEVPMPEIEQQVRGEVIFAELRQANRLGTDIAAELDALLPAILDRAFKGEL